MTTSKIKEIVEVTEHTNDYGVTYYHNLVMQNGDKINIGKKKKQLPSWELTYEITGDESEMFRKAKAVQKEEGDYPAKNDSKTFKADPVKQASIELQVCLKESREWLEHQGYESQDKKKKLDEVIDVAKYLFDKLFK